MTVTVDGPGTWRVGDGSAVEFIDAQTEWAPFAREVLIETAKKYHGFVTYKDLAEQVQLRSGVRTRSQMRNWIGSVLIIVADQGNANGEPALTALCVRTDESVGEGFAHVVALTGAEPSVDLEPLAATERMSCYRFFGAEIPTGGGHPALTPRVASARKRAAAAIVRPVVVCAICNMQVPASGVCENSH